MGFTRLAKVNSLLMTEVGRARGRHTITGAIATVTAVETAPDLRAATVWISLVPDSDAAWEEVTVLRGVLQSHVADRAHMKRTPVLTLQRDFGGAHARHIEDLLQSL